MHVRHMKSVLKALYPSLQLRPSVSSPFLHCQVLQIQLSYIFSYLSMSV